MNAEILCIGTELLLGDILNTNAQFLAKALAKLGVVVQYQTVVGDNQGRIKKVLDIAFERADLVVMTGGLGPTKDDLTKEMLAKYFGRQLVFDEIAMANIEERVQRFGGLKVSESNKKQALVPENSLIMYNHNGSAPGYIIENQGGKKAILLPGPPKEMEPMFKEYAQPYLAQFSHETFVSVNVKIRGIGESGAADRVAELLDYSNPTVAPYAKDGYMMFRLTAAAQTRGEAMTMIEPVVEQIKGKLGEFIFEVSEGD